jgi:short-subunit dehydrogenase
MSCNREPTTEDLIMENQRKPVALVTGGSSGIGFELAKLFVADGHDVIIAADDRAKLEEAAQALRGLARSSRVEGVEADLSRSDGAEGLYNAVRGLGLQVDVLVNNAGIGVYGDFVRETNLAAEVEMIQVNAVAAVQLTKLFLKEMVARGSGKVLFTASLASLSAVPFLTVYAATKAFVYSFAEGLREELKDTGVTVTALLPGATDTEFFERAGAENTKTAQGNLADPAEVAKAGYEALQKGDDHVVSPWKNKVAAVLTKLVPPQMAAKNARVEEVEEESPVSR